MFGFGPLTTGLGIGVLALGALVVVQSARLNHAKADQVDPKTHIKWEREYKDQSKVLAQSTANLERCNVSVANLGAGIAAQNSAVLALQASGERSAAAATQAAASAFRAADGSKRIASINAVHGDNCPVLHSLREAAR